MNCYVTFEILVGFGLDANTIYSGCKRYRQGKTKSWQNKKDATDARKVLIDLDTIPEATRTKYGIPTGKEYSEQRLQEYEAEQERQKIGRHEAQEREKTILASNELQALRNAYNNDYIPFLPLYREYYENNPRIEYYTQLSAKEHAFFLKMIEITGGKHRGDWGKAESCFKHYRLLTKELVFFRNIQNLDSFRTVLRDLRKCLTVGKSIVNVIGYGKTGERPELQKYADFHKGLILYYVSHEKKYSYRLCVDLINQHCIDENQTLLNESYIKKVMANDNEFKTLVYSRRNGTKFLNETILPHASRYPIEFPANLWMIDGTPMQFYCWNRNKAKIIRLSLFVILDAFSRKVVGFDIALNEDKFMVMNALKMAVKDEGHLPKEILSDNFSANKTDEIIYIKEQMLKMGVNWRLAKVGNPQDKSQVERFFGVFQSEECALYDDYLGEGITSRRDNRPNTEFLAKATKNLLSLEAMTNRIVTMVAKYNERVKRTRKSPLELYKLPKPRAVEIDCFKTALMFWTRTKHTIRQGVVKITVNKVEHTFEIKSHKLKLQLQGKTVYVRYDADDLESVILFDLQNETAICECEKSIKVYVESDQPKDNLMKHTAKVKSYKKHIDTEIETIYNNAFGGDFQPYRPLDLAKNQINEQESKDIIEAHNFDFGLKTDDVEPKQKPLERISKGKVVVDNSNYESGIVSKKAPKRSLLNVAETNLELV